MKYSLVIFSFLFLIIFTFSSTAQETAKANKGEGVLQFLKRFNRTKSFHFDRFIELNRDKLDKNNGLKLGVTYTLPPLQNEGNEPLFGEKLAKYTIDSDELNGACFYLVSGHGGPDPGAIGELRGHRYTRTSTPMTSCSVWPVTSCQKEPKYTSLSKTRRTAYATTNSLTSATGKPVWDKSFP